MIDAEKLTIFLTEPLETLTVEYKDWLDLQDQEHRGVLAKAAIALANEGGGYIVLGFSDDGPELTAMPRQRNFSLYDQDEINNIVKRFAEPHFHCTLLNVTNPLTRAIHPVVVVPGGHGMPIMSKSGTPKGKITAQICYVRKPGPASAPALTESDWSRLLERCIRNRKTEMLDAFRNIIQGHVDPGVAPSTSAQKLQDEFVMKSRARWGELTGELARDDPAKCPYGYYEVDFTFEVGKAIRLPALLDRMKSASRINYTGWSLFWVPTRPEIAPQAFNGAAECWHGRPDTARVSVDAAHSDFWRIFPEVRAFLVRGYQEDGLRDRPAGTVFDATLPIWRVGKTILYAGRLAAELNSTGFLQFHVRWSGLRNRLLTFVADWSRSTGGHYRAAQDTAESAISIPLDRIEENLPEILHPLLQPLYESFGFFELPEGLVAQELAKMRRGQ